MEFFAWIALILCASIVLIPTARQRILIRPLFKLSKAKLPEMSATERAAIEAGDVWWDAALFQGKPNWDQLLALPKPELAHAELAFLNNEVEELCSIINDWQVSHVDLDLPESVWAYLKQAKFFGMIIPKEYNGLGFSALAHSTIVQKIASHSLTAAVTTMVPNSLGPADLLIHYGTEEQKRYYLPRLAVGEEIPCFALTSALAGSDAGAMIDYGVVCQGEFQGQEIIGMKLTWNKRYITLAPIATLLGLAFKLYDPDKLLGEQNALGITLCLIPTSHPGVQIGRRHFPLHQAFMNGPTSGTDVFVPLDWIIGGAAMVGQGWRMLVECLSTGRGISLPALSVANAKVCYRATGAYAAIRKQFRTEIGKFEGIEEALASIAGYTYLTEATRLLTLTALDHSIRPSVVTAMVKLHTTEISRIILNKAMDIHGGRGIMLGPNNYLGRSYESIPISITVEGANILTRNLMVFGQGAIRCHPYIQQEIQAMSHPDLTVGLRMFDKIVIKHIRYSVLNIIKSIFHGITAGIFCSAPRVLALRYYYRQIGRLSRALSMVADLSLIILGSGLKRRERLSARLGDVLSELYLGSAVLKYYYDFGDARTGDLAHAQWCLQTCLYKAQHAFLEFCRNFPIRWVGLLFRVIIFPFGRAYVRPADALEHHLARMMMTPSLFRERLTQHCYKNQESAHPLAHLEETLQRMTDTAEDSKKLSDAIKAGSISAAAHYKEQIAAGVSLGILTAGQAAALHLCHQACMEAIRVDDFLYEPFTGKLK